ALLHFRRHAVDAEFRRALQAAHVGDADTQPGPPDAAAGAAVVVRQAHVEAGAGAAVPLVHPHLVQPAPAAVRLQLAVHRQGPGEVGPLPGGPAHPLADHAVLVGDLVLDGFLVRHHQHRPADHLAAAVAGADVAHRVVAIALAVLDGAADHLQRDQDGQ